MLKSTPRVELVPLSSSEVELFLDKSDASLGQRESSSVPAPAVTEGARKPDSYTELDSLPAALDVSDPDCKPRGQSSSSGTVRKLTPPASNSSIRMTHNSLNAAMSPRELEFLPRSQKKRASTSAAREGTEPAAKPVPQTKQDSSFAALEVTEPVRKPILRSGRSSLSIPIEGTIPASKPRSRTRGISLDAVADALKQNKQDATSTAPAVTEPATLKPVSLTENNSQYGPIENTDSTSETLPPKERNPSSTPTVIGAATSAEPSLSPYQETSSCTPAVNEAVALRTPSPPLSSRQSTSTARESPEPNPSSVEQQLDQQPCSSRQQKIRRLARSGEYDHNFRFYYHQEENYLCNECFIF